MQAGLDVEMPYRMIRATGLGRALDEGRVSWDQVDAAAQRVVATRLRFDRILGSPRPPREILASPAHRALAREVSARSVVLLRNEPVDGRPILPLELGPGDTVALLGRLAGTINLGDGGSSDVWAPEVVTTSEGLRAALPGVTFVEPDPDDDPGGRRRRRSKQRWPSWWWATPASTRASTSVSSPPTISSHLFPGWRRPRADRAIRASIAAERVDRAPLVSSGGDGRRVRHRW